MGADSREKIMQTGDRVLPVISRVTDREERSRLWKMLVEEAPGYNFVKPMFAANCPALLIACFGAFKIALSAI